MTLPDKLESLDAVEIVGLLNAIHDGDHERGCEGRSYECTCGYDGATWSTAERAAATLTALSRRNAELTAKLDMLQLREAAYRSAHDLYGDGSMNAGQAWDAMRRAGDAARAALGGSTDDKA